MNVNGVLAGFRIVIVQSRIVRFEPAPPEQRRLPREIPHVDDQVNPLENDVLALEVYHGGLRSGRLEIRSLHVEERTVTGPRPDQAAFSRDVNVVERERALIGQVNRPSNHLIQGDVERRLHRCTPRLGDTSDHRQGRLDVVDRRAPGPVREVATGIR